MKNFISTLVNRMTAFARPVSQEAIDLGAQDLEQHPHETASSDLGVQDRPTSIKRNARKSRDTTEYALGEVLNGYISGIEHYGVFVRLPNGESGLVFQNEICWPGEHIEYAVGSRVKVLVLAFKPGRGLALSIRETRTQEAFDGFVRDFPVGASLDGQIKSVLDYGIFVNLVPGVCGLLHVSEIPNIQAYGKHSIGQQISVRVGSIDIDQRRISLEMTQ